MDARLEKQQKNRLRKKKDGDDMHMIPHKTF